MKKYYLKKQENLFSDENKARSITENFSFYSVSLSNQDYATTVELWDKLLRDLYMQADRYESLGFLYKAKEIAENFLSQAASWNEEDRGEIWRIEDWKKVIQRNIDFWEECEREDRPFHRPD